MKHGAGSLLVRLVVLLAVASILPEGGDHDMVALAGAFDCQVETASVLIDSAGTLEAVAAAKAWNALLAVTAPLRAATDHDNLPASQVIARVDALASDIACVARVFKLPPALLAGLLAAEMDLDYHRADTIVDMLIASGWGDALAVLDMGMGMGGVHHGGLRRALAALGSSFSSSPFYEVYFRVTMRADAMRLTRLASRYVLFDLANVAVLARHYAELRMGGAPLEAMTVVDMAFTWSAYRGGVIASPADPDGPRRWSAERLQQASDPRSEPDALLARPYFAYYGALFAEELGGAGRRVAAAS
jgi:hypothetical protein